jgi:YVTN family beta-propeller protein
MNSPSFPQLPCVGFTSKNFHFCRSAVRWFSAATLALGLLADTHAAEVRSTGALLLVANKSDQTLGLIDPMAGHQIVAISEDGITGHEVAASPDGRRAFVPIYGNSGVGRLGTDGSIIRVIDLARKEIVATIDLGRPLRPHCAKFGPKNGLLYVTTELDESVTMIDPATLKVIGTVPTGQKESHMLAISRDGRRGYTANVGPGTVSVLDLENNKLITVIPVAAHTQRIALSADDKWAFTTDQSDPRVAVIDTATNKVASWIKLPGIGFSTAATSDGRWLLVTIPGKNLVAVVDLHSKEVIQTLDLPRAPQELMMRPDGLVAYVSCDTSRQVGVIDLKTWKVAQLIDAGPGADGLAWAVGQ